MTTPSATPAPLTMTPEQEKKDRDHNARIQGLEFGSAASDRLARWIAETDATRAKLAEAEALASAMLEKSGARCAALVETLRECEEWFDGRADVDDGPDGQPVPNSAMRMQQLCAAALSPSQDAKGGA